jgi:hypothetical protein
MSQHFLYVLYNERSAFECQGQYVALVKEDLIHFKRQPDPKTEHEWRMC